MKSTDFLTQSTFLAKPVERAPFLVFTGLRGYDDYVPVPVIFLRFLPPPGGKRVEKKERVKWKKRCVTRLPGKSFRHPWNKTERQKIR
ncbi:hypothetical protein AKJ37_03970 [candidate division MSBL1 archaeon SCGC-AAA259I09]|uniref:Uncharacterized protein n=1 Tax=candidate division MSBL1 archaeon SCGC-AAA259I09 TaxID=1698267 RepID=A0A133URY4_9EURY|nr:hypothetical protein AKJ37_03970 [candidate division MSBL1 archaeon SCGC-AAA259I09]